MKFPGSLPKNTNNVYFTTKTVFSLLKNEKFDCRENKNYFVHEKIKSIAFPAL